MRRMPIKGIVDKRCFIASVLGNDSGALKKVKQKMRVLKENEQQLDSFFKARAKTLAPQINNHFKKQDWKIIGRYYKNRGERLKAHLEALRMLQHELKKNHFNCDEALKCTANINTKQLYDETFIPFIKLKRRSRKFASSHRKYLSC